VWWFQIQFWAGECWQKFCMPGLLFVPTSSNIQISIQPLLRQMNAEVGGGITTGQSAASVDDVFPCTFQIPIDFTINTPYSLILCRQDRFWLVTCGFPEDVVGPRAPVNENQVILLWVACSWPFVELIYHRPAGSACRTANKAAKLLTFQGYIFSRENKV